MSSSKEPSVSDTKTTALDPAKQQRRWVVRLTVVLGILIAGMLAHLWFEHQKEMRLRADVARRFQTDATLDTKVKNQIKSLQDTIDLMQSQIASLESKLSSNQNQHAALEQMYQEFARNHDDRILADIEQLLLLADQQLSLSGNVHGALSVIENADKLLAKGTLPRFIEIRGILAKDMERLRAVPYVDISGMALKLDGVIEEIETLPLLADSQIKKAAEAMPKEGDAASKETAAKAVEDKKEGWSLADTWNNWQKAFMNEMRGMVVVRNVSSPDAVILSSSQVYFLREKLALRLLGARMAIIGKDHVSFSGDMKAVMKMIDTYFDPASERVKSVKATLLNIIEKNVAVKLPDLSASIAAVKNYQEKQ